MPQLCLAAGLVSASLSLVGFEASAAFFFPFLFPFGAAPLVTVLDRGRDVTAAFRLANISLQNVV